MTGLFNNQLILGDYTFSGLSFQKSLKFGNEYNFTTTSDNLTFQIPSFNSNKNYVIVLSTTSDTSYSSLIGSPLNKCNISNTGLITVPVIGTYYVYEFESSSFDME